ncbi:PorV/PorQ family protein [bacterium]|nr:PorV/PorQ family protein [bacterium]
MIRFVLLLICISFTALYAGERGYQFLRVGVPARATGLGDTYVSQFGDVNTFMYNPAGLSKLSHKQFSAGYMNHILDIGSGHAAYAQPYKDIGVFGAGLVYFGYGDFKGYDASGYATSSFSSSDYALSLFYARQLKENVHFGATVKIIRSAIENYSSGAVAVDVGAIYILPQYDAQVGASLLNAGIVTHAFLNHKEKLPVSFQLGVSRKWNFTTFSLNLSDLNLPGNRLERFAVSAEADPWKKITMRIGYNQQRKSELDLKGSGFLNGASGLSAGLGFKHQNYVFDYSFASWGIGAVNRFSLTVNF